MHMSQKNLNKICKYSLLGLAIAAGCEAIGVPTTLASMPLPLHYAHEGHSHSSSEPHGVDSTHPPATPHHADDGSHEHGMLEIPLGQPIPSIELVIHPDTRRGWNLEIKVTNFAFAPERVNQSSTPHEGHAHLYIDGVKITRLYGTWYYLESLAPGTHEITVSLNANGHETLMHNGQPIQATERIIVQP